MSKGQAGSEGQRDGVAVSSLCTLPVSASKIAHLRV